MKIDKCPFINGACYCHYKVKIKSKKIKCKISDFYKCTLFKKWKKNNKTLFKKWKKNNKI